MRLSHFIVFLATAAGTYTALNWNNNEKVLQDALVETYTAYRASSEIQRSYELLGEAGALDALHEQMCTQRQVLIFRLKSIPELYRSDVSKMLKENASHDDVCADYYSWMSPNVSLERTA